MRAGHTLSQLVEKRLLDLGEFRRIHDLEDVLNFVEEHDFLGAIGLRPIPQQSKNNLKRDVQCYYKMKTSGGKKSHLFGQG